MFYLRSNIFCRCFSLCAGGIIYSCVGIAGVQNIMGLIFSMSIFLGMLNCMAVQPVYGAERPVFYRERAARMYSPGPYALASALAELPYLAAQAIIMVRSNPSVLAYYFITTDKLKKSVLKSIDANPLVCVT